MAKKLMLLALATTFLAVGCVAFPENDGYYDGRYDHRSDRDYTITMIEIMTIAMIASAIVNIGNINNAKTV